MGGAMLAMVACGAYGSVKECCEKLARVADTVQPEPALVAKYERKYERFREIYPACKQLFADLAKE